ncbi:MAG: hypothetical protein WC613_05865 [Candidatus Aenigmatarchaeota archaeon]
MVKIDPDSYIRFLIDPKLCRKFKIKLKEAGYSNRSEFFREKIRDFVYEGDDSGKS